MSGLTNKYVEEIGKEHCNNFLGVFPCNIHPEIKERKTFSVIFNESKHNEEGTHFVCVYANENKAYYFDSLGLKCENNYILQFLKNTQRIIIENNRQIQSYNSIFCGYFCLSFIIFMFIKNNFKKYFIFFSEKNLKINDNIVTDLLIKMLKIK
jgi:hypothetical protein